MDKRERVARAICESIWFADAWDEVDTRSYNTAAAAIAAMEEDE